MRRVVRELVLLAGLAAVSLQINSLVHADDRPNFVVIFADDLGYGDLGCFGHPTISTPELDRMALEGMRWTQFYSAAPVCTPSRAALLTGRLPMRSGMCSNVRRVLFPDSKGGLPASEVTLAEMLREAGYRTACVGKWHLGHLAQFLPTEHGFDQYFGIPYSNDMDRVADAPKGMEAIFNPKSEYFNVPLMRDQEIIQRPADQTTITKRYAEEAIKFIQAPAEKPFFLYLAHSMPHVPLFRSQEFAGHSQRGLFGDVVEELDWSVGQILQALRDSEHAKNTLVVFTSDNGPWLSQKQHGGSAGLLKEGKGTTWDGGMREPTIMWWPGHIEPTTTTALGSTMDLMATFAGYAHAQLPTDRVLDSIDLSPIIDGEELRPRQQLLYYRGYELMAVRLGPWKVHFQEQGSYGTLPKNLTKCEPPKLYHLERDPAERYNIAEDHPKIVQRALNLAQKHLSTTESAESQLEL
ncbi:MAG: sulfatase [Planctomycetales bacterium]|nr:sulfatase [Planctomycetales bacterium]